MTEIIISDPQFNDSLLETISRMVHETQESVFLTKNGYGDMVVMSIEVYEAGQFESEIFHKLKESELDAKSTNMQYSHEEVFT